MLVDLAVWSLGAPWMQGERPRVVRFETSSEVGGEPDRPAGRSGSGDRGAGLDESAIRARVESARSGDPEAYGELFRAFRADVERLCARMLGSRDEAEDACSEAFLRARRALEGYDDAQPFRRWLLSIAAHHCVDRLRRRSTERRLFAAEVAGEDLAHPGPSPLHRRLRAEARSELLAAVEALPDRYRAPLVLRYYAELDYESIAQALDVTRSQVATLLFRGKRRLRQALAEGGGAKS